MSRRLGAQAADRLLGDAVPIAVEPGRVLIKEDEAGQVGRPHRVVEDRRVQRVSKLIRRQDVLPPVPHERRRVRHRVQQSLHAWPDP
jgi:hypothetical protein